MMTVLQHGAMILPTGAGIGAVLHPVCDVKSFILAAGLPPIITVDEPFVIVPGPAGVQAAILQIMVVSPTRAAIAPPIMTVASPELMAIGVEG